MGFIERLRMQKQAEYEVLIERDRQDINIRAMVIREEERRFIRNQNLANRAQVNLNDSGIITILSELGKVLGGKVTPIEWNEHGRWNGFEADEVAKAFGRGNPMSKGLLFAWESGKVKGNINVRTFAVESTQYGELRIRGGRFGSTAVPKGANVDVLDRALEKAYRRPVGYSYRHEKVQPGDDSWSGGEGD